MPSFDDVYGQSAASAASQTTPSTEPQSQGQPEPSSVQPSISPSSALPPSALPLAAIDLAAKLFDLARTGTTPTLLAYITAGIPPNLTNSSGDTLLMLASYHGHPDTARMLLGNGADANVLNARGQSPIAGAVFKGYDDVVRALYEGGADVRLGQPNAVDCARMFKRGSCLKLFGVEEGEGTTISIGE